MNNKLLISILAFTLSGCTQTVWVNQSTDKGDTFSEVEGIPFYTKKETFELKTSYARTWFETNLKIETKLLYAPPANAEPKFILLKTQEFKKQIASADLPKLNNIKADISKVSSRNDLQLTKLVNDYNQINSNIDLTSALTSSHRIENTISSKWEVDNSKTYYLNAPLPWFGTGNLTQEINENGTLSKVTANPDTKLAEGISSLIPFKEYLTGKYVDPLSDDTDAEATEKIDTQASAIKSQSKKNISQFKLNTSIVHFVTLSINEVGYIYTFTQQYNDSSSIPSYLPYDLDNYQFTKKPISQAATPKVEEAKKGKSIDISGTINLPED